MGGYSPYPSLFVDDAARQVLLLDPRTCRGYNLAQRPRLSSSTQESFDNVLALRVPAEIARPRVPHVRMVALNVLVHRIDPPVIPVISLHNRQLQPHAIKIKAHGCSATMGSGLAALWPSLRIGDSISGASIQ